MAPKSQTPLDNVNELAKVVMTQLGNSFKTCEMNGLAQQNLANEIAIEQVCATYMLAQAMAAALPVLNKIEHAIQEMVG